MICPNCGKEYNEKMTCCISCGSPLIPYDQEMEQLSFESMIPESAADNAGKKDADIRQNGLEYGTVKYSGYPAEDPELPEDNVPVKVYDDKKAFPQKAAVRAASFAAAAVMFVFVMLAAASFTVRLITDSKKLSEFAERLDVMNLPAAQAGISNGGYNISDDATVQEAIFVMSEGTGLTREDIKEIYENSTASDFLASQLEGYALFIRSGDIPDKLTSEKLKAVFSENIDLISSSMGKPLSGHDIDLAFSELERAEPVLEEISPSRLEAVLGEGALAALRLFSSLPVITAEWCAAAAVLIILRALNKRAEYVLAWGGGALLSGGAVILAAAFLCSMQVFFTGQDRFVRSIIKCVTDVIDPDIYRLGGILAAVGAIMILWAVTIRKTKKA